MTQSPQQIALTAKIVDGIKRGYITAGMQQTLALAPTSFQPFPFSTSSAGLPQLVAAGVILQQNVPDAIAEYKLTPDFIWPPGTPIIYAAGTLPPA